MKIWIVDAFASKPYTGNPAAVMVVPEFPEDAVCQKIAQEINLSETAFVKSLPDGTFHIRWFTPTTEVKLCGHATLASAHILFQEKLVSGNGVNLTCLSGPLSVTRDAEFLTLNFPLQQTGASLPIEPFKEQICLHDSVVAVVQAYDDVIVELETPESVRQLVLDESNVLKVDCRGLIVTAKGDGPYDFISRFFAPRVGVNEDPVTGSAHCKLAHYWQKKLNKDAFFAYQASTRGGEIRINIDHDRVLLTGQAITIMQGNWLA